MRKAKYQAGWLSGRPENTQKAYRQALEDFEKRTSVPVDQAVKHDVMDWKRLMVESGLKSRTINQRVSALSSYFDWCVKSDLRELNPAVIHRMKVNSYEIKVVLTAQEVQQFLQAIRARELMASNSITLIRAKQDYALFLGYILMAFRNVEWARAKVEDFRIGNKVMYSWYGKGSSGWQEVPEPVWEAVQDYAQTMGLFKGYLFHALGKKVRNLGCEAGGHLSNTEVNRRLHYYAKRAGMDKPGLHVHSLKHTSLNLLRTAAHAPKDEIQMVGKHKNGSTTEIYLQALEGITGYNWQSVADVIGV